MKNIRFAPFVLLLLFAAAVIAPACSQKVGCPKATHAGDIFDKQAKKKNSKSKN